MNQPLKVCILTAGLGSRMGHYSNIINKALLPLDNKAIISHIIARFPQNTTFVIALGHLADQVTQYLEAAHPENNFQYVTVNNYNGPGSGPGYSLLKCSEKLQCPFFFVACDTLWSKDIELYADENWFATAAINSEHSAQYCNFKLNSNNEILSIHDKEQVIGDQYQAFCGLAFIKDYSIFWDSLKDETLLIKNEVQVSNGLQALLKSHTVKAHSLDWVDLGNLQLYERHVSTFIDYDFSKTDEFLYILNNRTIKFFSNSNIAVNRASRAKSNPEVFPEILFSSGQFYSYKYIPGETLYQNCNIQIFRDLLKFLNNHLWIIKDIASDKLLESSNKFYKDKTLERLKNYLNKYSVIDRPVTINGYYTPPLKDLLARIPWDILLESVPVCFHGDLQFDNILYDKQTMTFKLIDWRQDFGGLTEAGDIYYDFAKLNGGLLLNYDLIKKNLFSFEENNDDISLDFSHRYLGNQYQVILHKFIVDNGYDVNKVNLLTAIIYLNMAPLHHAPFDKLLYNLGKHLLDVALRKYENK